MSGRGSCRGTFAAEEIKQCRIDFLGVGPPDVVGAVLDLNHGEIGDQLLVPESGGGGLEWQDPVGGAVDYERWDVDLGEVAAEVGQPGIDARVRRVRGRAGGDLEARSERGVADPLRCELIGVVEVREEAVEPRVAVREDRLLDPVETHRRGRPWGCRRSATETAE